MSHSQADGTEPSGIADELRDGVRAAWHRYLDALLPLRGALFRYCRELTGGLWDAEDLVQETLLVGFGRLALVHYTVEDRAAYLIRCATEAWLARQSVAVRAGRVEPSGPALAAATIGALAEPGGVVGAGALARLRDWLEPPDACPTLRTAPPATGSARAKAELVDHFVEAYNARNLERLLHLMLVDGAVEMVGSLVEIGRDVLAQEGGWFDRVLFGHPEWPPALQFDSPRVERACVDAELLAVGFTTRFGQEAMESVLRFDERAGRISRIRYYVFCPEVVREVGAALGHEVRTGLYRYPTRSPGVAWADPE